MTLRYNLCPNPAAGADTAGWSTGAGAPVRATDVTGLPVTTGIRFTANNYVQTPTGVVTPGQTITASFYVNNRTTVAQNSKTVYLAFTRSVGGDDFSQTTVVSYATGVSRKSITGVAPANATGVYLVIDALNGTLGSGFDVSAVMYEPVGALDTYGDGSISGWTWDGTPFDSTSTRPEPGTPVSADFDLRWRVRNAISKDVDLRWRVISSVGVLKLPTAELVAVAWAKAVLSDAGIAVPPVVTKLPDVARWVTTGAVQVIGTGGGMAHDTDIRDSIMSFEGWAARPDSDKPPYGQANGLLEFLRAACYADPDSYRELALEPADTYRPVRVLAVVPTTAEPRRIPDPDASRAHFSMDLRMIWSVA